MAGFCCCDNSNSGYLNEDQDNQCGCQVGCASIKKRFPFPWLNCFATPKFALFFLCLASIGQGFLTSGLLSVVISTLEQRFHLHSTETGFIASSYDIASCLCVLLITYLGGKGHKPLWIGWGVFIMGTGSLVFAMPHFFAPAYEYGKEEHNVCNSVIIHGKCLPSNLKAYMFFFVLGQALHGAGGTTLFSLGVTYLDENVSQVQSSLYHGVYYASGIIGPAFGYLFGGRLLTIYTDINKKVDITDKSSLWIGAWWLGFLVGGILVLILAFPILLLPKNLPGTEHLRVGREGEVHRNKSSSAIRFSSAKPKFKDAWYSLLTLLRNPTFLLLTLAGTFDTGLVLGLTTFGPKYLQSMYSISPTQAATYFGLLAILAGVTGQLIGGIVVSKAKLTVKGILRFCLGCSVFTLFTIFVFFSTCPNLPFAGSTTPYINESRLSAYIHTASCNEMCNCNSDAYDPVCGDDGVTYYSPCLAGCKQISHDYQSYLNCSCISTHKSSASAGKCEATSCNSLPVFLAIFFFSILGTFLPSTPAIQAILRVVPFSERSFAIGVKFVFLRLLGSIPAPIIIGKVLDLACAVWSTECGNTGACELYMNDQLAKRLAMFIAVVKILIVVFFIAAYFVYNPSPQDSADLLDESTLTTHREGGSLGEFVNHRRSAPNVSYTALQEEHDIDL